MQKALTIAVVLSATNRMTSVIDSAVNQSIRKIEQLAMRTKKLSEQSMNFGKDAAMVGLGIGAAFAYPVKAAMEFETGMTNVRKVVDGLKDESAFKAMSDEVLKLGREIPMAYSELTDLVAAGGRMNVPRDKLIAYTKSVAQMSIAFDMAAGEIGDQMGKLSVAFKIPIENIATLGDTINYLDDNSISKGADIINVLQRMAGTAQQVGLGADKAAALASTFLTLGSSAEVAGTASQAMLRELSIATMQGGEIQSALKENGLNAEDLQKQMSIDPQNTLLGVLDKLNELKPERQIEITTKLFGKEYGDDAAKLAQGVGEYRRQIELLSNSKVKGSMTREFDARMKTSAAQATIFKNSLVEIAITIGNAILPALNSVLQAVKPAIEAFGNWAKNNPELIETIAKIGAAIAAVSIAAGALSFIFGGVLKVVSLGVGVFGFVSKALYATTIAVRALSSAFLLNPIGLAITAIGASVYLIYEYWEPITEFFKNLWDGVIQIFKDAYAIAMGIWDALTNPIGSVQKANSAILAEVQRGANPAQSNTNILEPTTFQKIQAIQKGETPTAALQQGSKTNVGGNTLNYQPNITIGGSMTDKDKASLFEQLGNQKREFERMLKETNRQNERKNY